MPEFLLCQLMLDIFISIFAFVIQGERQSAPVHWSTLRLSSLWRHLLHEVHSSCSHRERFLPSICCSAGSLCPVADRKWGRRHSGFPHLSVPSSPIEMFQLKAKIWAGYLMDQFSCFVLFSFLFLCFDYTFWHLRKSHLPLIMTKKQGSWFAKHCVPDLTWDRLSVIWDTSR